MRAEGRAEGKDWREGEWRNHCRVRHCVGEKALDWESGSVVSLHNNSILIIIMVNIDQALKGTKHSADYVALSLSLPTIL